MKFPWIVFAVTALVAGSGIIAADPALARVKQKAQRHCVDRPHAFSWSGILTNPAPQPNGCAPPVFDSSGKFVGQDPDPNIRAQLSRDPHTGYSPQQSN
jgi:hypothetical protein